MDATLLGALTAAAVLGVTHAVEPDHVAGIASLTSRYGDPRLSALVGACFSAGHVALVLVWLAVGSLLLGRTEFPALFDRVGTAGVTLLLGILGTVLLLGGLRRVASAHTHEHEHGDEIHTHAHTHLPLLGSREHDHSPESGPGPGHDPEHSHDHTVSAYLRTGVVGALFTLSPPLSMIAFAATLFPAGPELVVVAVGAYAVTITATMRALGAGVGAAFGRMGELNVRIYGGVQALAGALVAGLGVSLALGVLPVLG